jgi:Predicted thioesterase involved in non-ribosomal peptide biosynthesis
MERPHHPGDTAWLRRFHHSEDPRGRVIVFPHAGGSAQFYRPLAGILSRNFDTLAVQYPHRLERLHEPAVTSVVELARHVARAVPDDDLPIILLGHSMGALVAYEACLALPAGAPVAMLVASASHAPAEAAGREVPQHDEELLAELRTLGGTHPHVWDKPELVDLLLPTLRADFAAVRAYGRAERIQLRCPILALAGADDERVRPDQARRWSSYTASAFRQTVLPGGHFYLEHTAEEILRQLLETESIWT